MDISEAQVYEALGLEAPAGGENEPEAAVPAAEPGRGPSAEGEREQENAEPAAGEEEEESAGGGDSPANEADAPEAVPPEMTPEERRENAARRRREEQQAAVQAAVDEALRQERERAAGEWSAFFQRAGLKNTLTNAPITSREEFDRWEADFRAARLEKELKAGKLTREGLDAAIAQNPAVQQAGELLRKQSEEAKRAEQEAARARIEEQVAKIHALDPSIGTVEDLLRMPKAKEFYAYVQKGNSFEDAWYLTHREELAARAAETARRQAVANARSKDHLAGPGRSVGSGAAEVPPDVMAYYKALMPEATEKEIREHWNRSRKK